MLMNSKVSYKNEVVWCEEVSIDGEFVVLKNVKIRTCLQLSWRTYNQTIFCGYEFLSKVMILKSIINHIVSVEKQEDWMDVTIEEAKKQRDKYQQKLDEEREKEYKNTLIKQELKDEIQLIKKKPWWKIWETID